MAVWCCEELFCLVCACECGICGAKCILLGVVLPLKFGLVVMWGVVFVKYVTIVDKDVVEWRRGVVVDGDDCGRWCVLRNIGCAVEYGMWYGLGGCGWKDVGMVATW